jgi:hypothetical protein
MESEIMDFFHCYLFLTYVTFSVDVGQPKLFALRMKYATLITKLPR